MPSRYGFYPDFPRTPIALLKTAQTRSCVLASLKRQASRIKRLAIREADHDASEPLCSTSAEARTGRSEALM
jgi:hypothetical protein